MNTTINWDDFAKVDIRTGTIVTAEHFKEAKNPSYKLTIDFGALGIKKSAAQLTSLYRPVDLIGMQILAVVNFPKKQIATMNSECLVLAAVGVDKETVLIQPERKTKNGLRIR